MSDGLKTGLIVAGAGVAAFLLYEHSRASAVAAGIPSVPGAGSNLATAPGAAPSGATSTSGGGGSSVASSVVKYAAIATIAPFYYPTKIGISAAKSVGSAVENVFKDIF